MLLREWDYRDPSGWIVQEKFDGIRAIWDGKRLLTREGHEVPCPDRFTADLPETPLDGELWTGKRGDLRGMLSIFASGLKGDWSSVEFRIFDTPTTAPLEERLSSIDAMDLPWPCKKSSWAPIKDECELEDHLDMIAQLGGEGVVLRQPGTPYEHKRSGYARKLRLAQGAPAAA